MINYYKMRDEELVHLIKNEESTEKCLDILIERHSGLCIDMINSYMSKNYNDSMRQELIKQKDSQIYSSAMTYDASKNSKFSTYLGNQIKWKCLNIYNKDKKRKTVPVEDELIEYFSYCNKNSTSEESSNSDLFSFVIKQAENHSDKRISKIFKLRYIEGSNNSVMPWRMISEELNMSIQGCINLHNSAMNQFRKKVIKEIK
jgi:DNA-directed RNA polymerase specialized sigma24 family protein